MTSDKKFIRFIKRDEIDDRKWNDCIAQSATPLIYATIIYLDAMCKDWDALVLRDYEAVMPLPRNRKWGIYYIYSPYFVIGGGVFGKEVTAQMVTLFVNSIPEKFRYIDLDLNENNLFTEGFEKEKIRFRTRCNTLLPLSEEYDVIKSKYHTLAKRNLKKSNTFGFELEKNVVVSQIISMYKELYKEKDPVVTDFDFAPMTELFQKELQENVRTFLLCFPDGEMAAFFLVLTDKNYVYWLLGGSTERGRACGAFYHITDRVIAEFAGSKKVFRFEGSDIEGIRFFNLQFGGSVVQYTRLTINRLPWPLKLFKR